MERYAVVAGLILVILTTGCTAGGGDDGGEDVRVTPSDGLTVEFSPGRAVFTENEVLAFTFRVQNTGEREARGITPGVFGSPLVGLEGKQCGTTLTDQLTGSLRPANPSTNQPGRTEEGELECDAPLRLNGFDLPSGARDTFTAGFEIQYRYVTNATTRVSVKQPSEIGSKRTVSTDNTAAPVHAEVDLKSPQSPRQDGTLSVPVTIENVGDGEVVGPVEYTIRVDDGEPVGGKARLVDGSRQVVEDLSGFSDAGTTYDVTVDLSYTYREETTSPFTVEGQPDGVTIEER